MAHTTRHRSTLIFVALTLAVSLGFSLACATVVAPTVTMAPVARIDKSDRIFVVAPQQREAIMRSLKAAGLRPTDKPEGGYLLEVRVGNSRGSRDCGTVNNVVYILKSSGTRIMIIKGRGETGACSPSIFDQMSRKMASFAS